MRRIIRLLAVVVGFSGAIQALAVTPVPLPITGNLGAIQGTGQPYAGVSIQLQNCASPVSITGYFGIVQTGYQIRAGSSGLITGTVWPNDLITCNGTTGNSEYNVLMIVNGVPSGTPQCYQVTSTQGAWNLNTQQPITCSQSPPNPQDAQFRNLNVTGCFSVDGGGCGGGGGGGIASVNSQTGPAITIACGTGLSCVTTANTVTVGLASAFTINSFSGCAGTVELGRSLVNPAFTASYSATPASAAITNTDSIGSPLNLTTPFTAGTVTGTFAHSSVTTTTFTLTAIGSSTQTANCTDTWQPRIFAGLGATGATSSVTASGTTAVLSTSDVLPSVQLGAEAVGTQFGPFMPSGQNIYLLLIGGTHSFIDACNGFPFAFNAPIAVTFVNSNGASVGMFLYSSTNPLTYIGGCAYTPKVQS
jgi:large repetitive protein